MNAHFPFGLHAGNAQRYAIENSVTPRAHSTVSGKTLFALGSSVTFGYASCEQALGEYLARRLSMKLIKDAVNGTTLAGSGADSYVARLKNHTRETDSPDFFLVQLSTNDATQGLPLDDVQEAIVEIIDHIHHEWNAPVIFYTNTYFDNENYAAMVDMLEHLQQSRSDFDIIDLFHNDELNQVSAAQRQLYMVDDIHPTRAGYFTWWGPVVEQSLMSIIQ